jgi:hypothetical protein
MKVLDFDSDVLQLVIGEVIACLAENSTIAESVFLLIHMYLSIRP